MVVDGRWRWRRALDEADEGEDEAAGAEPAMAGMGSFSGGVAAFFAAFRVETAAGLLDVESRSVMRLGRVNIQSLRAACKTVRRCD